MTITTELVIARHGEAVCNVAGVVGGERGCTGLTERGLREVQALATRLSAEHAIRPFDAMYGSPRLRVRQSAQPVGDRLGLTATVEDELRGPDHGEADGQLSQDVKATFGGPPQHNPEQPYAPGSETWSEYLRRAVAALRRILTDHSGARILIIGHGETTDAAHSLLLDLPPAAGNGPGFVTEHTGLVRWQHHVDARCPQRHQTPD
jgi:2,3-bisphosphoglycerate-dependent phosphoglycerate mutase